MKKLALLVPLIFLLAGCGTTQTYRASLPAGPAKPADYPIPVYTLNMRIPRPVELIGELSIGDTQLTMHGGSMPEVMETIMKTAHEKGADVVELTSIKAPDFESAHFRVTAKMLRYADTWETVAISENQFLTYLQQHRQTLDPIEGLWSDGSPALIGVMRNTARPGRDYVGFLFNVTLPSWQKGYRKIDLAHTDRPGAYSLKYYRDDFGMVKTTFLLDHEHTFSFMMTTDDKTDEVTFTKIATPMPFN